VTDKDGRYVIPAWGPMVRPPLFHLEHHDPAIEIFLPGYYPRHLANAIRGTAYSRDSVRVSLWDGREIALRKFTGEPREYMEEDANSKYTVKVSGTLNEYANKLSALQTLLHWQMGSPSDEWHNFPRMVAALRHERERFATLGINPNYQIDSVDTLHGG